MSDKGHSNLAKAACLDNYRHNKLGIICNYLTLLRVIN